MIELDGHRLTLDEATRVVLEGERAEISPPARERVHASQAALRKLVAEGRTVYGVSTGLGKLSRVSIAADDLETLQLNLVRSHALGVGPPLPESVVRAMLLFRANSLLRGCSGVRLRTVELLLGCLNAGVIPSVPSQGSVGASGDLAPLAHLALVLIGEGEAWYQSTLHRGGEALARAGLRPLEGLAAKEGLALLNGTSYMLAHCFHAWTLGKRALRGALAAAALTFQTLRGRTEALDGRLHAERAHPGQVRVAEVMRRLLAGSRLTDSLHDDVQDPYSLRCLAQIVGPSVEALDFVEERLTREANAATDNPLVFADGAALSGGNFHGQILALCGEVLGIGLAGLGLSCERRVALLMSSPERGVPEFLTDRGGLHSGLMLAQYTAAALAAENKVLAHPAAVDSIPTSAGKEDHNSMGSIACWKALRIAENLVHQVALELLCAARAVDLVGADGLSSPTRETYSAVRAISPAVDGDAYLAADLERLAGAVREGKVGSDVS